MICKHWVSALDVPLDLRRCMLHAITWVAVALAIRYYSIPALTRDNLEVVQHASFVILAQSIFVFYFLSYVIFPRFLHQRNSISLILSLALLFQLLYIWNYFEFQYLSQISDGSSGSTKLYVPRVWEEYFDIHPFWACFTNFSLAYINYAWSLFYVTPLLAVKVTRNVIASRTLNLRLERDSLTLEKNNLDLQRQRLQLQRDNLDLELNFLKSQINPHFLFNTLNSIYVKTTEVDESAAELVFRLSNLMRYSLYKSNKPLVRLEEEIEYIENYVALEVVRFSGTVEILFHHHIPEEQLLIAPLLLISLLENAFKHGIRRSIKNPFVYIQIRAIGPKLIFSVKNSSEKSQDGTEHPKTMESGGFGISNTVKRLMLLYPDRHKLDIREGDDYFEVELHLYLSKDTSMSAHVK